jgi:hypothetical protein
MNEYEKINTSLGDTVTVTDRNGNSITLTILDLDPKGKTLFLGDTDLKLSFLRVGQTLLVKSDD